MVGIMNYIYFNTVGRGTIQLNNEHIAFRWVAKQDIAKMDIMLGVEEI